MTLARLFVVLGLNSAGFNAGMMSAIAQVNALNRSMIGMNVGAGLSTVGRRLTYGLTLPIVAAGIAVGVVGNKLTTEMARVQSLLDDPTGARSTALIDDWTNSVQQLGIDMGRTSPEVTGGLYEIVSALGPVSNAIEYLAIASKSAVAGQSDIVTSTKNLVLATRAWGNSSTEAVQMMADMGSQTVKVGTLTESELGPALAGMLPLAKAYGVGLDEVYGSLSAYSGVMGSANRVSTGFQRSILSLVAPNTAMAKAYKAMGVSSGEALIDMYGLTGALQQVAAWSEKAGVPLPKLLGRVEALKFAETGLGLQGVVLIEHMAGLVNAAGSVDSAFEGTTGGINAVAFQWAQATQTMRVILEDLYISLAPAALNVVKSLAPVGEAMKTMAQAVTDMPTDQLTLIVGTLLGLAALGPVLTLIGGLAQTFTALRAVAVALSGPVGILAVAFAGLWLAYDHNWLGTKDKIAEAWGWITANAPNVRRELDQLSAAIKEIATPPKVEGPGEAQAGIFQRYSQALKEFYDTAKEVWSTVGQQSATFQAQMQGLATNVGAAWGSLKETVSGVVQAIIQSFTGITIGVMGMVLGVGAAFVGLAGFFTGAATIIGGFVTSIKTTMTNAVAAARTGIANIKSAFTGAGWVSVGSSIISGIVQGIRNGIGAITSAAKNAAAAALAAAKSALGINSPSSAFRDQVAGNSMAGWALGIYRNSYMVQDALRSVAMLGGGYGGVGLSPAMALQSGSSYALAGDGGSTNSSQTTFGDINVYVNGTNATPQEIGQGITQALQRRGML